MSLRWDPEVLHQSILSVCITQEIDLIPHDDGIRLPGDALVTWAELDGVCGSRSPASSGGRRRIAGLLRLRAALAALGRRAGAALHDAVRVMALPADHVDHLGPSWAVARVGGGALWLGPGACLADVGPHPVPVPASVLAVAGVRLADCWPAATDRAARMSATAAELLGRDGRSAGRLGSVGDSDVLTLLGTRALRRALADGDGVGMRAVGVPHRAHGWWDLRRIDAHFLPLAWQATEEQDRGLPVPLLVTRDEVVAVRPGGRPGAAVSPPWAAPA